MFGEADMLKLNRHYNGLPQYFSRSRHSPGVQILVRANIKLAFEYDHGPGAPAGAAGSFFHPNGFTGGLDYAF
jgi:hypothetical protein